MKNIIGITGRKYSGKDTLGKILVEKYGYQRMAYADNLKEVCRIIFGFSEEQLYGDLKETPDTYWNETPRKIFQYIGTDLFRNQMGKILPQVGESIWIKSLEKTIKDTIANNPNVHIVITDVRFQNEIDSIKSLGGEIIKITRPNINNQDVHESESFIDFIEPDHLIINDQNINYLEQQLNKLM